MTKDLINELVSNAQFPQSCSFPELIETHISWVIVCDCFVYKIKKPMHYSFLDFSTLEKRKYYCEREVELNKRLTVDIYLNVLPVKKTSSKIFIGDGDGEVIDYAVEMRKLERDKQMDLLLLANKVTHSDIQNLAETIANFHKKADVIYEKNFLDVQRMFNDLEAEKIYLNEHLNINSGIIISHALATSDRFIERNKELLAARLKAGYFRDCHGDLHSKNIFLLPSPQPFDCLEFNDDFRQIDVLNDVAFLCMDLDAFGKKDLSDFFLNCYNNLFPSIKTDDDRRLFIYYKSYRANIRAKVNSLRARTAKDDAEKLFALKEADKYLQLMDEYMKVL